jgi:NAD(P)-dependent dehydrogenase (short-subunit alcohol dehydrogenase family)
MPGRLEGKVAVITGGASGIGAATAARFVEEGARVVVGDLQEEAGSAVVADLGEAATFLRCNVAREEEVAGLIEEATRRWGRLDVLFNNAGFGGAIGPIESITEADWDLTFDVLLKGVFFGMKHAAPVMKAQRSGSIISTASIAGLLTGYGPHLYNVAKAGVIHLTRTVANELAEHDVRVNCICPGFIATPLAAGSPVSWRGADEAAARVQRMREAGEGTQPLSRIGEGLDIANAALFLASDESEWITGVDLVVDGGFKLGRPWRKQQSWLREPAPIRLYRPPDR